MFLDSFRNEKVIEKQFNRFIKIAKQSGKAVAIGHPYKETLNVLERLLPRLTDHGIDLMTASEYIRREMAQNQYEISQQSIPVAATALLSAVQSSSKN